MTLLNTLSNIGSKWPNSLCLYILPMMTFQICEKYTLNNNNNNNNHEILPISCYNNNNLCLKSNGICNIQLDGYTIQMIVSIIIGIIWMYYYSKQLKSLQSLSHYEWLVYKLPLSSSSSSSSSSGMTIATVTSSTITGIIPHHSHHTPNKHSD